jgi:hypothetical protein
LGWAAAGALLLTLLWGSLALAASGGAGLVTLDISSQLQSGAGAPGAATITVTWPGHSTSCRALCAVRLRAGSRVTASAHAETGYALDHWSAPDLCAPVTDPECTFTMPGGDRELQAVLVAQTHVLDVVPGSAATISDPSASIDCTRDSTGALTGSCSAELAASARTTLTVTPAPGERLVGWSVWTCPGATASCTVTMDADTGVTALIDPVRLSVARVGGSGMITSTPAGIACDLSCTQASTQFPYDSVVTLKAVADPQTLFRRWSDPCGGPSPECTLRLFLDTTTSAAFGAVAPPVTPSVQSARPVAAATATSGCGSYGCYPFRVTATAGGFVRFTAPYGRTIDICRPQCSLAYPLGEAVQLRAVPQRGYRFLRWVNSPCTSRTTCTSYPIAYSWVKATFRKR